MHKGEEVDVSAYYPESSRITADVIAQGGATPVSCKILNGKIVPALAAERVGSAPEGVIAAAYSAGCGIYTAVTPEGIYESVGGKSFYSASSGTGTSPVIFEDWYGDAPHTVVFNDDTCFFSDGNSNITKLHSGKRLSCGLHRCGRLFGADGGDGYILRWSGEGGVLDWYQSISGAGWVRLRPELGKILALLPYGEKTAVIREYGVSEFSAYGTPETFKLSPDGSKTDAVYANTAAYIGGKIYFFTKSGMFLYSGSAARVSHSLSGDISSPVCCAAAGDTYLIGATSASLGGGALLAYDTSDGTDYLIDVGAEAVCADAVSALILGGGNSYRLCRAEKFLYVSGTLDFGVSSKKVLDSVYIDGAGEFDITISNGDISRIFTGVKGGIRLNMNGRKFTLRVSGSGEMRALSAGAEVIDGI